MTQSATGLYIENDYLDWLLAPGTPVVVNRAFGDLGFQALRNIIEEAGSISISPSELSLKARTGSACWESRHLSFRARLPPRFLAKRHVMMPIVAI